MAFPCTQFEMNAKMIRVSPCILECTMVSNISSVEDLTVFTNSPLVHIQYCILNINLSSGLANQYLKSVKYLSELSIRAFHS